MKKLFLSMALVCFVGAANIYAQSSDAKATTPAASATEVDAAGTTVLTQSGNQSVQTPATTKTAAKAESKKSCGSQAKKSCCMSKAGSSKMDCKDKHSEKAELKPEDSGIKNN